MAEFGSAESGASLGDILGAAISRARREDAVLSPPKEREEKSWPASRKAPADCRVASIFTM